VTIARYQRPPKSAGSYPTIAVACRKIVVFLGTNTSPYASPKMAVLSSCTSPGRLAPANSL
jgi:hypothetical protein